MAPHSFLLGSPRLYFLVPLPDHVPELVVRRAQSVVPHDPTQLSHRDLPVVVGVEEREGLLQAVELGVRELGGVARRKGLRP